MPAVELLCNLSHVNTDKLAKEELALIEAAFFTHLCEELKRIIAETYKHYFHLIKFNTEMENAMVEEKLVRCIVHDILASEEYTLEGIAYYTQIPEEVLYDITIGNITDPSATLVRKIIALHQTVRPELYKNIMKKMITEQAMVA